MASNPPDKVVRITMQAGIPVPDIDPVPVQKDNQKLRWCADFEFKITVIDYTDLKYSSSGPDCAFACKTGTFHEERTYKYTISANGVDNDPTLDVKPAP
jgi:hypothetical protein